MNNRITAFVLLLTLAIGLVASAATPIPSGLVDPTTRVWTRMEYPAELRPVVRDAFWRAYPSDRPAEAAGTPEEQMDLVHRKLKEFVTVIAIADLKQHGTIEEGDSVTEKQQLIDQRIAQLLAELDQHVTFTSGP